jgi:hypothetical protein
MEKDHNPFIDKNRVSREDSLINTFENLRALGGFNLDRVRFEKLCQAYLDFDMDTTISNESNLKGSTYKRFFY